MTTTINSITSGGIIKLSDGTNWRIAPDYFREIQWSNGMEIIVKQNATDKIWEFLLCNTTLDESVAAIRSSSRI